ncbi:MAG: acetamidase/formamidase family protein [Spirochaetales bacterium]|nr:acetamidase/formamidase family protein [Spirochaetales bacterium]
MQRATKDILYFEIGHDNKPTLEVDPGEEFEVETQMNAGPWLDTHPGGEMLRRKIVGGNPSSGCVYVRGAENGQVLSVTIGTIKLAGTGFTRFGGSTGAMPGYLGSTAIGEQSRVVAIRDNTILWDDRLTLDAKPMIGYVGVAPEKERYHNGWGGYWGGNFDIQEICPGATVHLPVNVPGALLHIGDMHAIQGDGEICGAGGIETEGVVRVSCALSSRQPGMDYPRVENETHIIAMGMARPAEDAFRSALSNLITWMEESYGFTRGDAYLLLGQVMEARCTQFVNPTYTYIAKIAKKYLLM